jgi:ubiquinone/menaquinone biosynthesis C-methylase UbiE
MAQNIYDNESFFDQYGQLPRSKHGLDGAAEWPTMKRMVGNIRGNTVLDLGCGMGWFCRYAAEQGAKNVLGLDISENMLAKARNFETSDAIVYQQQDLDKLEVVANAFDLVYSSLTLHYLSDLETLFTRLYRAVLPGGHFVFSVEHPTMTAPQGRSFTGSLKKDENDEVYWPLNSYSIEGLRETEWLGTKGVRKYHHMVETYLMTLLKVGFTLTAVRESWDGMNRNPRPDEEDWGGHKPFLLIVSATKPGPRTPSTLHSSLSN